MTDGAPVKTSGNGTRKRDQLTTEIRLLVAQISANGRSSRRRGVPTAVWIGAIVAVAAFLRLWHIEAIGFNGDETVYAGQAASIATMANWAANLVVAVSYLSIISAIGETGTFITYAAITVLSLVYVIKMVPETKGLSLSEIESELNPDSAPAAA